MAKKFMLEEGKIIVGYSSTRGSIYFWRIVLANPYLKKEDMFEHLNLLVKYCNQAYEVVVKEFKKE